MAGFISVKNFERFQHYKDRSPPWIKLYNDLLDDYEFCRLPDASKWLAVGLWLVASRHRNRIPNDPAWIGRMVHATDPVDLQPLLSAGFIYLSDDASNSLAKRSESAMPEKEVEREIDTTTTATETRERERAISGIILAANRGMQENPRIGAAYQPISTSHGSRQTVHDWLQAGIPPDFARAACFRRAKEYEPNGRQGRIASMKYFDLAVREEWEQSQTEAQSVDQRKGAGREVRRAEAKPDRFARLAIRSEGRTGTDG